MPANVMTSHPKRHGRLGLAKTHTGCKTCKARKIKCDEAKPECLRCTKTKRKCLGYEPWQVAPSEWYQGQLTAQGPYRRSPSMSPGTEKETMHYQYFIQHAAQCIAGILDTDFWSRLIPQISQTVPAVRHGIIAISSLFRQRYYALPQKPGLVPPEQSVDPQAATTLALKYYNKAIIATRKDMKQDDKDILVAVVTCVLFFCIESLQGKSSEAVSLYHRGQNLIDDVEERPMTTSPESLSIIRGDVAPMFSRLRVLAALHGSPRITKTDQTAYDAGPQNSSYSYPTLNEARAVLFDLTAEIHSFIAVAFEAKWTQRTEQLELQHTKLSTELAAWRSRALALLQLSLLTDPPKADILRQQATSSRIARLVLSSHYLIIYIWLKNALVRNETCYDDYLDTFRTVVGLCEKVLQIRHKIVPDPQAYTFEIGLIPVLFMTARKCREPQLRRRAVNLLREGSVQEGLWNAEHSIVIAARCIDIEEKEIPDKVNERGWPHEDDRLHETMITERVRNIEGNTGRVACFFQRHDTQWYIWEERFDTPLNHAFSVRSPGQPPVY